MKILISNAVWGEAYCSIFARFSLASLLSARNIPALAKRATITCHLVTRAVDRRRLRSDPAIKELERYCEIEWDIIEDYGVHQPPEGPGGEKYPFLSSLQNLSIRRSVDHDVIIFNYADFIWADGSLANAVDMLGAEGRPMDAVFSFCLPVDRDLAVSALEKHRLAERTQVIELAPRDGAMIAIDCIHREAKIRFWEETPGRFTNLPSYLIWRVDDKGLLIRSYHQTILAMRVRKGDPQYLAGIVRGGLDSSFAGQLAESPSLAFATDTDQVLVFSLYHTIVDSRVPEGVTREMSLQNLLTREVTPQQRRFSDRPILVKTRSGGEQEWNEVAEKTWKLLQEAHRATAFDQAAYDKVLETHGVVPKIKKHTLFSRYLLSPIEAGVSRAGGGLSTLLAVPSRIVARAQRVKFVLGEPKLLDEAIERRFGMHSVEMWRALRQPSLLSGMFKRSGRKLLELLTGRRSYFVTPNIWVNADANACFVKAIAIEDAVSKGNYDIAELRKGEALLRRAVKMVPVWTGAVHTLGRNLWFQGRFDEAMQVFADAEHLRDVSAWVAKWPVDACVFLPRNCAESIGLMGHIDAFVKYKILTADPRPYYLVAPSKDVVNRAFLEYWKDHITIVSEHEEIVRLSPQEPVYMVNWNWAMPDGHQVVFVHKGIAATQRGWERTGRPPLLTLRRHHADVLSYARGRWGMQETDRFVCLHVRAFGFYRDAHDKAQEFRNTPIESYYPLIRDLTERGLWVIRMGDRSMPPLDLSQCGIAQHVVDYALSADKSAELDVALCAKCELFVSSPSGLHTVAHAFGRPVCEVNYPIYSGFPWNTGEIFIPQLYFSREKGRVLTLREILGTDVVHRDHQFLLEAAGLELVPNEPDEIVEAVREAFSPSTYRVKDSARADRVLAAFEELNHQHKLGISGRLGQYFAMKYADQLLSE